MSEVPNCPKELMDAIFANTGCYLHSSVVSTSCPLCTVIEDQRRYFRSLLEIGATSDMTMS